MFQIIREAGHHSVTRIVESLCAGILVGLRRR